MKEKPEGREMVCNRCGYVWKYKGSKSDNIGCPRCCNVISKVKQKRERMLDEIAQQIKDNPEKERFLSALRASGAGFCRSKEGKLGQVPQDLLNKGYSLAGNNLSMRALYFYFPDLIVIGKIGVGTSGKIFCCLKGYEEKMRRFLPLERQRYLCKNCGKYLSLMDLKITSAKHANLRYAHSKRTKEAVVLSTICPFCNHEFADISIPLEREFGQYTGLAVEYLQEKGFPIEKIASTEDTIFAKNAVSFRDEVSLHHSKSTARGVHGRK